MSFQSPRVASDLRGTAHTPRHVAIMPDGTRRWARENNEDASEGYLETVRRLPSMVETARRAGIEAMSFHAFSQENWGRSSAEVGSFMALFRKAYSEILPVLHEYGVRVRFIGSKDGLPPDLVSSFEEAEELTKANTGINLWMAINYSGQTEIVDAARKLVSDGLAPEDIDRRTFAEYLYDPELPEVDLLIRSGREVRISNFLLWGLAHAELYFTDTLWPDFDDDELLKALDAYSQRSRRHGK